MPEEILFSQHALRQLQERGMSQVEIRLALIEPDKIVPQSNSRFCAAKRLSQRHVLIIIYDQINERKEIVTVFRTSKINKYL